MCEQAIRFRARLCGSCFPRLLGHEVEAQALRVALPARLSAPNLPELNYSQVSAVQAVLQAPLSLIQGARRARSQLESAPIAPLLLLHIEWRC